MTRPCRIASVLALSSAAASLLSACQPPSAKRDAAAEADLVTEQLGPSAPAQPTDPPLGVSDGSHPATGRPCRVYLRRDAMGQSGVVPMPLNATNSAARAVQLQGTLDRVGDRWVAVRAAGRVYWIPTDMILAIEYDDDRP